MTLKEDFTVKELAEELNITTQALQNRMNNIPNFRAEHVTSPAKHRIMIDAEGAELLRKFNQDNRNVKNDNSELIQLLKEQHEHDRKEIDKLLKLLDQSQQLELTEKNEIKALKEQLQSTINLPSTYKVPDNNETEKDRLDADKSTKQEESKHLNFLQRITKRFKS